MGVSWGCIMLQGICRGCSRIYGDINVPTSITTRFYPPCRITRIMLTFQEEFK